LKCLKRLHHLKAHFKLGPCVRSKSNRSSVILKLMIPRALMLLISSMP
jgi:hypothetical protein